MRENHWSKTGKYIPWNKGKKGLQKAWNKGLTKENDVRVKKYAESKRKFKNENKVYL